MNGNGAKLLTAAEAAKYLGVTRSTLYKYKEAGLLAYHKIGSMRFRISIEDLDRFIERRRVPAIWEQQL